MQAKSEDGRQKDADRVTAIPPASPMRTRDLLEFVRVYRMDPFERVRVVKAGLPPETVGALAKGMALPVAKLAHILGLQPLSVRRKVREQQRLTSDESSRVLGMARLIGQAQTIVDESGDPDRFNAAIWVSEWLELPQPALGTKPADFMDTAEGQQCMSNLLGRIHSGAYS